MASATSSTSPPSCASSAPLPHCDAGLAYLDAWNAEILALEKTFPFVHVVDVHTLFLGHGIHCRDQTNPHYDPQDPGYWYYWNLEDPNLRGYDAIRRAYLKKWADVHAPAQQNG